MDAKTTYTKIILQKRSLEEFIQYKIGKLETDWHKYCYNSMIDQFKLGLISGKLNMLREILGFMKDQESKDE